MKYIIKLQCTEIWNRMMSDETERLIDSVRECVYLYDTSHLDYKDSVKTPLWT